MLKKRTRLGELCKFNKKRPTFWIVLLTRCILFGLIPHKSIEIRWRCHVAAICQIEHAPQASNTQIDNPRKIYLCVIYSVRGTKRFRWFSHWSEILKGMKSDLDFKRNLYLRWAKIKLNRELLEYLSLNFSPFFYHFNSFETSPRFLVDVIWKSEQTCRIPTYHEERIFRQMKSKETEMRV